MAEKPAASGDVRGRRRKIEASSARPDPQVLQTRLDEAQCESVRLRHEIESLRHRAEECETARSEVARLSKELDLRALRLEQQTAIARQFQNLFSPPVLPHPEGMSFSVSYEPCPRVGGDFYDIFHMGAGCVGVFVADVAGYGLAATLVTAVAKMALDTFRQNEFSPKAILEKVNAHVVRHTLSHQFFTAFLGVVDLGTHTMKYVNAAHPCPVVFSDSRFDLLNTEGLCCGIFEDPRYEERETALNPGDRLLLFTRGVIETCNRSGAPFGEARLHATLRSHRGDPVGDIVHRLARDYAEFVNGAEMVEDLTLVGVEMIARKAAERRIVIPSEPQLLPRVEDPVLQRLEELNYGERTLFAVRLALEEAVINAIKHGNKMDKARNVTVTYSIDDRECRISVEDEGPGFTPQAVPDPTEDENLELPHGRGLMLMRAYMDEVTFNEQGNRVTLRKKAPWAQ